MTASERSKAELYEAIQTVRTRLGSDVTLVGHHYQNENVIAHCDARGDSLELARMVHGIASRAIVFCGVYFMGESAALLAKPGQHVYLPEDDAECVMALMSPARLVERVLERLTATGRRIIPLAYVNSTLDVKAVVGRHGGSVCTSANARRMMEWAFAQGDAVLFLPDKNLSRNTTFAMGMSEDQMHILDIRKRGDALDMEAAERAKLVMWPGLCAIHARFKPAHVVTARAAHPGCCVVVHPECDPTVVALADVSGSTTTIIQTVRKAAPGSTVVVGTEINLVKRLAAENRDRNVTVVPLLESECMHMAAVTPEKLLATLIAIENGTASPVCIAPEDAELARLALQRMLEVCK